MGDFSSARQLLRWAKEDLEQFDALSKRFLDDGAYTVFFDPDPETGHLFVKARVADVPDELCKLASHALWDIKHALDHAAFAAVVSIYGPDVGDIHFPIASHPNDLDFKLRHTPKGKTDPRFPVALHDLFRGFEPYPTSDKYSGGGDDFVILSKLANSTKHSVSLKTTAQAHLAGAFGTGGIVKLFVNYWDGAKNELTFGLVKAGAELDMNVQIALQICFGEVERWKGYSAFDILCGYGAAVETIVDDLEDAVS